MPSFGNGAKRRERARRESHSETRVSRAGGVIPRSRGPRQDTSAKPTEGTRVLGLRAFPPVLGTPRHPRSPFESADARRTAATVRSADRRVRDTEQEGTVLSAFTGARLDAARESTSQTKSFFQSVLDRATRVGLPSYRDGKSTEKQFSQCSVVGLGFIYKILRRISVRI